MDTFFELIGCTDEGVRSTILYSFMYVLDNCIKRSDHRVETNLVKLGGLSHSKLQMLSNEGEVKEGEVNIVRYIVKEYFRVFDMHQGRDQAAGLVLQQINGTGMRFNSLFGVVTHESWAIDRDISDAVHEWTDPKEEEGS